MPDLLFQQMSTVQTDKQPVPFTIPSASAIAPLTFLTFVTGITPLVNIVPPVSGAHMLTLIFTNALPGVFSTSGNIKRAVQPVQNIPVVMIYDPVTALYWPANAS